MDVDLPINAKKAPASELAGPLSIRHTPG